MSIPVFNFSSTTLTSPPISSHSLQRCPRCNDMVDKIIEINNQRMFFSGCESCLTNLLLRYLKLDDLVHEAHNVLIDSLYVITLPSGQSKIDEVCNKINKVADLINRA